MIYRHYKGNLYFKVGFATRFSKEFPATYVEKVFDARYSEAKTSQEKQLIPVFLVTDKLVGSTYYAYNSDLVDGLQTLYKDLDGNHWLRPIEMFNEKLKDGKTYRFALVKGEELFNIISNFKVNN